MTQFRPEYALAAGFLCIAEPGKDDFRADLLAGALFTDVRLTRKLFRELEIIHEMINPFVPPHFIGSPAVLDAAERLPAYREHVDSQNSLRPVSVPSPAATIVQMAGCREAVVPYLDAIASRPRITSETRDRLTQTVSILGGEPLDQLVARTGVGVQVLSLRTDRAAYACRNGIYLKSRDRDREEFTPCSNFSLRIDESSLGVEDRLFHRLILLLGESCTRFEITDRNFEKGARLLEAATRAAVTAGFPVYPRLNQPEDTRQLPAIVKATYGLAGDHLILKANELVTWIDALAEDDQMRAGVILHAALAWLHRGCWGLASYLLLPSPEHLEWMGQLLGLVPVEVGRSDRGHLGVPRLMESF